MIERLRRKNVLTEALVSSVSGFLKDYYYPGLDPNKDPVPILEFNVHHETVYVNNQTLKRSYVQKMIKSVIVNVFHLIPDQFFHLNRNLNPNSNNNRGIFSVFTTET